MRPDETRSALVNDAAPRLPVLDSCRGLAALAVVVFHMGVIAQSGYGDGSALLAHPAVAQFMTLASWGHLGVPVFFVLSGFCVGQTWIRSATWTGFGLRRVARILPGYYASLILIVVLAVSVRLITGVNDVATVPTFTVGNVVATLTLMTSPAMSTPAMNWVYWTLSHEVVFYLVLTALLAVPARARVTVLVTVHLAISMVGLRLGVVTGPWFAAILWPVFALGLALALWPHARAASLLIGGSSLVSCLLLYFEPRYSTQPLAALASALVIGLALRGVRWPRWRRLEQVGIWSYSLYLIHVPLLLAAGKHLLLQPGMTPFAFLAGNAVVLAVLIAASVPFHHYCERAWLRRRQPAPPAAALATAN